MENINEKNLFAFLESMRKVENSRDILSEIFNVYMKYFEIGKVSFAKIHNHISEVFGVDANYLLLYLVDPSVNILKDNDRNLKLINDLKLKYGFILRDLQIESKNPFALSFAEYSVENGNSHHKVILKRADGAKLETMITPGELVPILTLLNQALANSVNNGIYHLDENNLEKYIASCDENISLFTDILHKSKEKE